MYKNGDTMKHEPISDDEFIETTSKIEIEVFEDNTKCGEVLIGQTAEFTFVCVLCQNQYKDIYEFGDHIREIHFQAVSETSSPNASLHRAETDDEYVRQDEKLAPNTFQKTTRKKKRTIQPNISPREDTIDDDKDAESQVDNNHLMSKKTVNANIDSYCKLCDRTFKNRASLMKHERIHQIPENLKCKYCEKVCLHRTDYAEHLKTHPGPKKFPCAYCSQCFKAPSFRKIHENLHHTGERPHKCSHCSRGFVSKYHLQVHIKRHLKQTRYACEFCGKRYIVNSELTIHRRTHTGEKPFQCEECGKSFTAQVKLTEHRKRHLNLRNFVCEICHKAFYNRVRLKDHMLAHTNDRPYACKVCGQTFPRQRALRAHSMLHSANKRYVCDICGKAFAQNAGLYSHKRSHVEIVK